MTPPSRLALINESWLVLRAIDKKCEFAGVGPDVEFAGVGSSVEVGFENREVACITTDF